VVEGLVRLVFIAVMAMTSAAFVGCATRAPDAVIFDLPVQDPLNDSPAKSLWQSGVLARDNNNLAAASRYFERALSLAPDSSWLYRELAELRLRQGDDAAAEGLARKALRYAPSDPAYQSVLWQLVATSRQRQGNEKGAESARREADMLWSRKAAK
tara:strand:+ start:38416 stop:38883 length:468 start_codon:yes stop_codon:yes gene_type:complete